MFKKTLSVHFPVSYAGFNKVDVIKAIRMLTGLGLKDAKDKCEVPGWTVIDARCSERLAGFGVEYLSASGVFDTAVEMLRDNNVKVEWYGYSEKLTESEPYEPSDPDEVSEENTDKANMASQLRTLIHDALHCYELDLARDLIDVLQRYKQAGKN